MSTPSRAALFDLDGTLLDSLPAFLAITQRACRELGWPQPGPEYLRQVLTLGRSPITALLGPVADAEARQHALAAASQGFWKELFAERARPFHDALPVLQRLAASGWRLGIVTDSDHFVVSRLTETPGCPPLEVIVTRHEAPARKPSPSGIALALQRLGLAPAAAIYVGDNPIDIQAAHGAGVPAFGITTGASRHADLLAHAPQAVVDSLTQLCEHLTGPSPAAAPTLRGTLVSGLGQASGFLAIGWVREAIEALLGGPFHPGTVNLAAAPEAAAQATRLRHDPRLKRFELAAREGFCPALLHAVELRHGARRCPALLLWPQVPGYPDDKLELICRLPLRRAWALGDGAALELRYLTVEEPWP